MRILILCTGNSARSQMAEGLLKSFGPDVEVHSAGTQPAARVHPAAVEAMREIGVDIGSNYPKSVDQFLPEPFDFVITVCDNAKETCPVFAGDVRRRVHIPFEDPANVAGSPAVVLDTFRRVRDEIRSRLHEFYITQIKHRGCRPAALPDLGAVSALLTECGLPQDGLADQFGPNYAIAECDGAVAGVAGIEVHGHDGLLRSVAVAPGRRKSGLGAVLVGDRLEWSKARGLRAVYLLTTTAADYFRRLGFATVMRDDAPDAIQRSREFAQACPSTAVLMRLGL